MNPEESEKVADAPKSKLRKLAPKIYVNTESIEFPEPPMHKFLNEIQNLIIVMQGKVNHFKTRWLNVNKPEDITNCVIIQVSGLSKYHYENEALININNLFSECAEIVSPCVYGSTTEDEIFTFSHKCNSSALQKRLHLERINDPQWLTIFNIKNQDVDYNPINKHATPGFLSKVDLLLPPAVMVERSFPLPLKGWESTHSEYVQTKTSYTPVTSDSALFTLDAEMCRTTSKFSELTKLAILNENGDTIYKTLVKPGNPIIDYLTKYSGVTEADLVEVQTTLKDVQEKIQEILSPDSIICGHSMECDLRAIQMMHPFIIDSSFSYNLHGDYAKKDGLRKLSKKFLKRTIQKSSVIGHDPHEDCLASLDLIKLKLKNGFHFGNALDGFDVDSYLDKNIKVPENIFEILDRRKKKVLLIDTKDNLKKFDNACITKVESDTNEESAKNIGQSVDHYLTFSHLKYSLLPSDNEESDESDTSNTLELEKIDSLVKEAFEACKKGTLIILIFPGNELESGLVFLECKS